jgi:hypothetical protein
MPTNCERVATDLLQRFNERRFDEYVAGFTDDAVVTYPQSAERIVGADNLRAMFHAFESPPTFAVTSTRLCGDDVIVEADGDYGSGEPWKVVIIYTFRERRVCAETAYFGAPFEAPAWRAPFATE